MPVLSVVPVLHLLPSTLASSLFAFPAYLPSNNQLPQHLVLLKTAEEVQAYIKEIFPEISEDTLTGLPDGKTLIDAFRRDSLGAICSSWEDEGRLLEILDEMKAQIKAFSMVQDRDEEPEEPPSPDVPFSVDTQGPEKYDWPLKGDQHAPGVRNPHAQTVKLPSLGRRGDLQSFLTYMRDPYFKNLAHLSEKVCVKMAKALFQEAGYVIAQGEVAEFLTFKKELVLFCRSLLLPERMSDKLPPPAPSAAVEAAWKCLKQLGLDSTEALSAFQLEHFKVDLVRPVKRKDNRVSNFTPDPWQVKLLDAVDANKSVLVCAPTSTGKTFISFYCMEKILLQSNEGIVVYVAPTKALVNQVVADVIARFEKPSLKAGKSIYGTFTRDYRHHQDTSQILVTVPEAFKILLCSPDMREWAKKIKYVILDEIHQITEEDIGIAWEHILMTISCPFIALSATIGNLPQFAKWLCRLELLKRQGSRPEDVFTCIQHRERFSHLESISYTPPPGGFQAVQDNLKAAVSLASFLKASANHHAFSAVHPLNMLSFEKLARDALPADFSMSPKACLRLVTSLHKAATSHKDTALLKRLETEFSPATFFSQGTDRAVGEQGRGLWITKQGARDFDKELLSLMTLLAKGESTAPIVREALALAGDGTTPDETAGPTTGLMDTFLRDGVLGLVCSLASHGKLPAILFSFSKILCDSNAKQVASALARKEGKLDYLLGLFSGWESEAKKSWQEGKERKREKRVAAWENQHLTERQQRNMYDDDDGNDSDDPGAMPIKFTLIPRRKRLSLEDWQDIYDYLRPRDPWEFIALLYGIGVHHAGKSPKSREIVELLFRQGVLQVVFATGSLALGVNMPCKTSVFFGDSIFLTPLMYRQMAGRAGRRGLDPNGEVLFVGVMPAKVQRLAGSAVSDILAAFPFSTSYVLQQLLALRGNPKYLPTIKRGLKLPLFETGVARQTSETKQFMRFAVDFIYNFLWHSG